MNGSHSRIDYLNKKRPTWFGHVNRMEEWRLPKLVFYWEPFGKRKRGRPPVS